MSYFKRGKRAALNHEQGSRDRPCPGCLSFEQDYQSEPLRCSGQERK
jgi:hypothetical protein